MNNNTDRKNEFHRVTTHIKKEILTCFDRFLQSNKCRYNLIGVKLATTIGVELPQLLLVLRFENRNGHASRLKFLELL